MEHMEKRKEKKGHATICALLLDLWFPTLLIRSYTRCLFFGLLLIASVSS